MADGYRNHHQRQQHQPPPLSSFPHGGPMKRHRSDFDGSMSAMPTSRDVESYLPRDEDRGIARSVKDTRTIDSAYDRYLQRTVQTPSMPYEDAGPLRPGVNNMMPGLPTGELMGRGMSFGREPPRLPADASNTLYVEGLPSNCSRREVAHIFRPFVGYRDVRLVTKDSKHRSGDPIVLCFVDFENPACAATALSALQGYRMDEHEPDSKILRLQFSRNPSRRPRQHGGRR